MSETFLAASVWLIPLCPLAAAIVVALFGNALFRTKGHRVVVAALAVSCLLSWGQLASVAVAAWHAHGEAASSEAGSAETSPATVQGQRTGPIAAGFDWITIGSLHLHTDVQIDALTAVVLTMVTSVSLLVAIYASGYMHGDPGYSRFFAELALFVFSMCMLVMARNFVVLFIFWEAVGLCSYLLVGFWFERPSASKAAVKAFVTNRIGDAALLIGIYLIWTTFGSLDFADVFSGAKVHPPVANFSQRVLLICLCLFAGACGKSAQFPLHLWLPDAMEGPTPVSALIHAATMVTAGVYLVARCTPLFILAPEVQALVATIGGITALLGALIALTQTDLKRVLAYSTISQLGYMFLALGSAAAGEAFAAAAVTAALFHMFTHAFFKALLFLSAGNVMHSMGNIIDMRQFSGLRKVLPVTHATFLCGAAALAGFPFLSGFWSKDEIFGVLLNASRHGDHPDLFRALFWVAFVTAILTAFYTFRAYFLTFFGPTRIPPEAFAHGHHDASPSHHGEVAAHAHDSHLESSAGQIHEGPAVMKWPLVVLAGFALAIGLIVGPTRLFTDWIAQTSALHGGEAETFQWLLAGGSMLAVLAGIGVAVVMYARPSNLPQRARALFGPLYDLSLNKFYLDEIANVLVILPVKTLAFLSLVADQGIVDRLVDAVGSIPAFFGRFLRPVQSGVIQSYALVMLFGLAIFLTTILQLVPFPMSGVFLATILLPLVAGLLLLVVRWPAAIVRQFALATTTATLLLSIVLAIQFQHLPAPTPNPQSPIQPRFEVRQEWMTFGRHMPREQSGILAQRTIHLDFLLGLDGISMSLVLLTSLLTFSAVLISWKAVQDRLCQYFASLLILEAGLNGAFSAFDLVLFYVFFEFTLLPLFFLVGIWGGPKRREASVKFFLYTFAGSVITLTGLVVLLTQLLSRPDVAHPFSIPDIATALTEHPLPRKLQIGIFLAMSLGFAIKVPLFPFHTWLPLAHVEAPTAGSVILAGLLLKLGAYGFLRFCLPFLPVACLVVGLPLIGTLAVIGVLYGALCAYAQTDLKKLVAYSSISHLGFCMLGMFALNAEGMTGSFLQIINHGLSTGALFLLVGMVYERYHTREIGDFGGLASRLPLISAAMVFSCLASIGLPGLNGFVGEFLSLIGMYKASPALACVGTLGVILAAVYLLTMLQKAFFGPVGALPLSHPVPDMGVREAWSLVPLLVLCLALGVYPKPLIDAVKPDIEAVSRIYDKVRAEERPAASVADLEVRR